MVIAKTGVLLVIFKFIKFVNVSLSIKVYFIFASYQPIVATNIYLI